MTDKKKRNKHPLKDAEEVNYSNVTKEDIIKAFEDLTLNIPKDAHKRQFKVLTGCATYGSIDAMEFCGVESCTNCTKRAEDFHEHMKEHVKNLFKDEEE